MKKINIGVLGYLQILPKTFIFQPQKNLDEFNLIGIASRSKIKLIFLPKEFDTKTFYSYESLLEDTSLDVYIPLPNSLHYEWIKKSFQKNLHILVEKSQA